MSTYPPPEYFTVRENFSFLIFKGADENKKALRLMQCLPDTFDPRGPKGK